MRTARRWCHYVLPSPTVLTSCSHHQPLLTLSLALRFSHLFHILTFSHLPFSLSQFPNLSHLQSIRLSSPVSLFFTFSKYPVLTPVSLPPSQLHCCRPVTAEGCCGDCSSSCCARRKIARSLGLGMPLTSLKMSLSVAVFTHSKS